MKSGEVSTDECTTTNRNCRLQRSPPQQTETMGSTFGTLILTEMMINPAGVGRANGTWFEFYNPRVSWNDLQDTGIIGLYNELDAQIVSQGVPQRVIIPGEEYYVIGRSSDVNFNGGVTVNSTYAVDIIMSEVRGRVRFYPNYGSDFVNVEWKNKSFPFQAGASLTFNLAALPAYSKLTNLTLIRDIQNNPANWFVTNAAYGNGLNKGTPGRANTFAVATKAPTKAPKAPTKPPTKAPKGPTKPPSKPPTRVPSKPLTKAPMTTGPAKMPSRPPTMAPVKGSTKIPTLSPLAAPVSNGATPDSPVASPGSPAASPGSPVASPGSPVASPGSPAASPSSPVAVPSKAATTAPVKSVTKAPMASLTKKPTLAPASVKECKVSCTVGRVIRGIRIHRRTRDGRCVEKCKWLLTKIYVRNSWRCGPCP
jgi:hypothetical protein